MPLSIAPRFFQGEYVLLNYFDFEGAERNICHNCVDKLWGKGKSETLKKVELSTFYWADESDEYKEEVGW